MTINFLEKINGKKSAIGTILTLDSISISEILSNCGYDWLFIDMEHGALPISSIQASIQVANKKCSTIVRIPDNDTIWIKQVLDTGCDGIIVPLVNNAEEAKKAVLASKYPPEGARSAGIARAHGFGMKFQEYISTANAKVALIIQIEHIDAVNNIDEILSVDGIDGVFIGPYDLSGSMGMLGDVTNEKVQEKITLIKDKCKEKNMPYGIFVMTSEAAKKEIEEKCNFIAVGIDSATLANASKANYDLLNNLS
jgi:2-dehydro-3-deoxyglucarate aldolase/4-hydroxy-2-oxoheptanedioate aldolase